MKEFMFVRNGCLRCVLRAVVHITFVLIVCATVMGSEESLIPSEVTEAILEGQWERAVRGLTADDALAADPVARMLVAHARLATNRLNEATALFLSVTTEQGMQRWRQWTDALLTDNRNNAIAFYLAADGRARCGEIQTAIVLVDKAIAVKPTFALAWNAKAVLSALVGLQQGDEGAIGRAFATLLQVRQIDPKLVVTHINVGFLLYLSRAVPSAAAGERVHIQGFDDALELDDTCALAYLGRGCIEFGMGRYDEAAWDFATAYILCPSLGVAGLNHAVTELQARAELETEAAALRLASRGPGTTINSESILRELERARERERVQALERFHQLTGEAPGEFRRSMAIQKLFSKPIFARSSEELREFAKQLGLLTVLAFADAQKRQYAQEAAETALKARQTYESLGRWQGLTSAGHWLRLGSMVAGLPWKTFASKKAFEVGWKPFTREGIVAAGKAVAFNYLPYEVRVTVDVLSSSLRLSILTALGHMLGRIGEEMTKAWQVQLSTYSNQARLNTLKIIWTDQRLREAFSQLPEWTDQRLREAFSQQLTGPEHLPHPTVRPPSTPLRAYYTSTDRPLAEIPCLVAQFNDLPRGARIGIIGDPFGVRPRIIADNLRRKGLQPVFLSPEQLVSGQFKSMDGLVGVKTPQQARAVEVFHRQNINIPGLTPPPRLDLDDLRRYLVPFFWGGGPPPPPGVIEIPGLATFRPVQSVPALPMQAPGGVLMRFVADWGDWPVIACSGLVYEAFLSGQRKEGQKR